MTGANERLALGKLVGPHGLHGVVKIQLFNRESTALCDDLVVELQREGASAARYSVCSVERVGHKGQARLGLTGVTTRDAAEALRGATLWIARASLSPLEDDEFYLADLIGLPVDRVGTDGQVQALGVITSFIANGPQDLLEVEWSTPQGERGTWLLPVLPQFLEQVDDARVRVCVPEGLLPASLEREEG